MKIIYCESEKQIIKINLRKDDLMKIFKIKKKLIKHFFRNIFKIMSFLIKNIINFINFKFQN